MKRLLRLVCLLLCLTLLPLSFTTADQEAPAQDVRVLLRRLNLTDRADLILDGEYTASSGGKMTMAFPRGAQVTVQIREGELYLFYAGFSLRVGKEITFVRNQSAESPNGLRFEKNGSIYPGTLTFTIDAGVLRPVLTINVEEYLLGAAWLGIGLYLFLQNRKRHN